MAIPSYKNPKMEEIIDSTNPTNRKRIPSIQHDICTWCGKPALDFRNAISRKEYTVSGFCQQCQDEVWGKD